MIDCLITGGGPSKQFLQIPPHCFTISVNMHHPNANCIFAIDYPIIKAILSNKEPGFEKQAIFTNYRMVETFRSKRVVEYDAEEISGVTSISSGLCAIVFAKTMNFRKIYLNGFDPELLSLEKQIKFSAVVGVADNIFKLGEDNAH